MKSKKDQRKLTIKESDLHGLCKTFMVLQVMITLSIL